MIKVIWDIAKHNSAALIVNNNNHELKNMCIINDYIKFFDELSNFETYEFIIEIPATCYKGKYNQYLVNQILGLIYTLVELNKLNVQFKYIYALDWLKHYPNLKIGKKYPKHLRIEEAKKLTNLKLNNDDEADVILIYNVIDKIQFRNIWCKIN